MTREAEDADRTDAELPAGTTTLADILFGDATFSDRPNPVTDGGEGDLEPVSNTDDREGLQEAIRASSAAGLTAEIDPRAEGPDDGDFITVFTDDAATTATEGVSHHLDATGETAHPRYVGVFGDADTETPPEPIPTIYALGLRGRVGEIEIDPVEVRVESVERCPHLGGWRAAFIPGGVEVTRR